MVIVNEDGTIGMSMITSPSGVPLKWREIEPFLWRMVGGEHSLSAKVEQGRVVRFSFDQTSPYMIFDRLPAWRATARMPVFIAAMATVLLITIAWPVTALVRRHYR